jgi:hypothetical protein
VAGGEQPGQVQYELGEPELGAHERYQSLDCGCLGGHGIDFFQVVGV